MKEKLIKYFAIVAPIAFKVLVAVLMIVGVVQTATPSGGDFMTATPMLFFTIQSNITIGVICFVFLVFYIIGLAKKQKINIPKWLYNAKFAFTVAITLTLMVFWLFLAPQMVKAGQGKYLATASNLCCHTFVPIFALLDWFLFDGEYRNKKYDFAWGTVMPLCYFVFAMICSACGVDFGGGQRVPYFFLDYFTLGWFRIGGGIGVFWWVVIIVFLVLGIGWLLMFGKNKIYHRLIKKEMNLPVDEVVTEEYKEKKDKDDGNQG